MTFMRKVMDILNMDNWHKQVDDPETIPIKQDSDLDPLPSLSNPHILPKCTADLKEWHYRALRRLNKCPVNKLPTGKIALEVDLPKFIHYAIKSGLLTVTIYSNSLNYIKNDALKRILKSNGLATSGNKKDLVNRILNNLEESGVKEHPDYSDYYLLTFKGKQIVDESISLMHSETLHFFKTTIDLIQQGELNQAYRMICKKYAEMPLPPDMECDWKHLYYNGLSAQEKNNYLHELNSSSDKLLTASIIFIKISGYSTHEVQKLLLDAFDAQSQVQYLTFHQQLMKYEITENEFNKTRGYLPSSTPTNDIFFAIFNARISTYRHSKSYRKLRDTYLSIAILLHDEKKLDQAFNHYCLVICFDINGLTIGSPLLIQWIVERVFRLKKFYDSFAVNMIYSQCKAPKILNKCAFQSLIFDICSLTEPCSYSNVQALLKKYS